MSSPPDGILVIKNGTLIDGTGGKPRPNGRIVIRGGKIAEVGPEGPFDQRTTRCLRNGSEACCRGRCRDRTNTRHVGTQSNGYSEATAIINR
jgi:hypothetical protein